MALVPCRISEGVHAKATANKKGLKAPTRCRYATANNTTHNTQSAARRLPHHITQSPHHTTHNRNSELRDRNHFFRCRKDKNDSSMRTTARHLLEWRRT